MKTSLMIALLFMGINLPTTTQAENTHVTKDVYLMYIPCLTEEDEGTTRVLLVHWKDATSGTNISCLVGGMFYRDMHEDALKKGLQTLKPNLLVQSGDNGLEITGAYLPFRPGYFIIKLKAESLGKSQWKGKAVVNVAPYFKRIDGEFTGEWGMMQAPSSVVHAEIVRFLEHYSRKRTYSSVKELISSLEDEGDEILKKEFKVSELFVSIVMRSLSAGDVAVRDGKFEVDGKQIRRLEDRKLVKAHFGFVNRVVNTPYKRKKSNNQMQNIGSNAPNSDL